MGTQALENKLTGNLTLETCPKSPYWPVNQTYNYGPSVEPTQLCFDASQIPEPYNGFLITFSNVKVVSPGHDSLCAILGVLPFTGGRMPYVTVSCSIQDGSIVAYGGVCTTRAMGDAYGMVFASESAIITPEPLRTSLSFSMSIQWTTTQIC